MKIYLKINSYKILKNIDSLLKRRATVFKTFLRNPQTPIQLKANIKSLEILQEKIHYFFLPKEEHIKKAVKGIYFGNDYCEHLIPEIEEIEQAFELAKSKKWQFVFSFPPISEFNTQKADEILKFLNTIKTQVVVNDYTVLHMALKYPNLKPILGIFLTKTIKPSITKHINNNQKEILKKTEFHIQNVREFYKRLNISRISIDNIPFDFSFIQEKPYFYIDLYYPYIKIANSKACYIAGLYNDIQNYFPVKQCKKYCEDTMLEFENTENFQAYNTIYKLNFELNLPENLYKKKQNRLIWEIFL